MWNHLFPFFTLLSGTVNVRGLWLQLSLIHRMGNCSQNQPEPFPGVDIQMQRDGGRPPPALRAIQGRAWGPQAGMEHFHVQTINIIISFYIGILLRSSQIWESTWKIRLWPTTPFILQESPWASALSLSSAPWLALTSHAPHPEGLGHVVCGVQWCVDVPPGSDITIPAFSGFHFLFLSARLLKSILQSLVALFSKLPWMAARGCCQRS